MGRLVLSIMFWELNEVLQHRALYFFFFAIENIEFLYSVASMAPPTDFFWVFIEIVSMTSVNGCCRGVSLLENEKKTAALSLRP